MPMLEKIPIQYIYTTSSNFTECHTSCITSMKKEGKQVIKTIFKMTEDDRPSFKKQRKYTIHTKNSNIV